MVDKPIIGRAQRIRHIGDVPETDNREENS